MLRILEEYRFLARAVGHSPSSEFVDAVRHWHEAIGVFRLPGDSIPLIGDNCYSFFDCDDAADLATLRALRPESYDTDDGGNGFIESESSFWLKALVNDTGTDCQASRTMSGGQTVRWFGSAGYLISRINEDSTPSLFVLDAGPLGYFHNPGHGHGDVLAVVLYREGHPVLIDPGVYRYRDDEESLWFKRAIAHNTVFFPGHEAGDLWRFFRWCRLPPRPELMYSLEPNGLRARAVFRGYERDLGARHKRKCDLQWSRGLVVEDEVSFLRSKRHRFGVSYHFAPGFEIRAEGHGWICSREGLTVHCEAEAHGGELSAIVAFEPVALGYGQLTMAPVIRLGLDSLEEIVTVAVHLKWA